MPQEMLVGRRGTTVATAARMTPRSLLVTTLLLLGAADLACTVRDPGTDTDTDTDTGTDTGASSEASSSASSGTDASSTDASSTDASSSSEPTGTGSTDASSSSEPPGTGSTTADPAYKRECQPGDFVCDDWGCEGVTQPGECYKPCTPSGEIGGVDSECDEPERPFCSQVGLSWGGDFDCNGCAHVCMAEAHNWCDYEADQCE